MARNPVEIPIASETKAFRQGIESGIIAPLEDADRKLAELGQSAGGEKAAASLETAGRAADTFADKLAAAARKAGKSDDEIKDALRDYGSSADEARRAVEKLGRSTEDAGRDGARGVDKLEDAMKDAQKETKDLERETKDTAQAIEREFRESYRSVKTSADDGLGGAKVAAKEVTQEVGQNLGEAVSSIRGDFSDLGQVGQDTLGGLAATVAGMGPAGLLGALALAAGATGLGALRAGLDDTSAKQERLREQAAEWAQAYIDSGGKVLNAAITAAKGLEIATDSERFKEAQTNARNWGTDVGTAIAAMSGEAWALSAAQESLAARTAEADAALGRQETQVDKSAGAAYDLADSVKAGQSSMSDLTGALEAGAQQADAYSQYLVAMARNTEGAKQSVDEFGDSVYELPDGTKVYVDAETGKATSDIEAIDSKIYSTNGHTATVSVGVRDNATAEVDRIISRLTGRTVTVNVQGKTVAGNGPLKPEFWK